MKNAPEGLSYSTDNRKYAHADKKESQLEKGKMRHENVAHSMLKTLRKEGVKEHEQGHWG